MEGLGSAQVEVLEVEDFGGGAVGGGVGAVASRWPHGTLGARGEAVSGALGFGFEIGNAHGMCVTIGSGSGGGEIGGCVPLSEAQVTPFARGPDGGGLGWAAGLA